jgi:hypothetical protein
MELMALISVTGLMAILTVLFSVELIDGRADPTNSIHTKIPTIVLFMFLSTSPNTWVKDYYPVGSFKCFDKIKR